LESSTSRDGSRLIVLPHFIRGFKATVLALALSLLALIGLGIYLQTRRGERQAIDSIAILPFANVGADPSTEYLADGIPESLINNLSRISNLRVVPRGIVFGYKGQKFDPQEVGGKLGVRTVLTGKVTRLYLLGRYHWNKYDESGFKKSIEYFQQAVDIDSNYALAYAGMADAHALLGVEHLRPKDFFPWAKVYAEKALRLDDTLAEAHNSLGIVKLFYEWKWAEAERAFIRARELDPNYADVGHFYGHYPEAMGRMDEAIRETKRGLESDPLSLIINAELGFATTGHGNTIRQ
jgi:tetratricopeptide (TPR) repeat protein